jgi:hypothetical protein
VLETPSDLNRVNSFLNLRVADIWACYKEWGGKGAFFLTEPLPNPDGWEWRCYMRDPDGYLIEVGQYTKVALDWFNHHSQFGERVNNQDSQSFLETSSSCLATGCFVTNGPHRSARSDG